MTDDRNEPTDKECSRSAPAMEEPLGEGEIVLVEEKIPAHPQDERFSPVISHEVRDQGTDQGAETRGKDRQAELPLSVRDEESDKGHDRLAGDRSDHAFQGHEDSGAEVAGRLQKPG